MNPIIGYANITSLTGTNISDGRSKQAQTPSGRTWGLFKESLVIIPKGQTIHDRIKDRLKDQSKTKATILVYIILLIKTTRILLVYRSVK